MTWALDIDMPPTSITTNQLLLKPLKYKNFEELKKFSKFDSDFLRKLKRRDIKDCYKHFIELELNARIKKREGDEEGAYTLYSRSMVMCRLIYDKMKEDDAFGRSKEARDWHESSSNVCITFELLVDNLRARYEELSKQGTIGTTKDVKQPEGCGSQAIKNGMDYSSSPSDDKHSSITPVELVHLLKKEGTAILLLDYRRENQEKYVKFNSPRGGRIDVVLMESASVVPGCLLPSIVKTVDISVRPYFEKLSQYEAVVLMGDTDDMAKQRGSKTLILYQALTTYNQRQTLKCAPLMLDGGFQSWEFAYPCYTAEKNDHNQTVTYTYKRTFDEQFTAWVKNLKQDSNISKINYPNLNAIVEDRRNARVKDVVERAVNSRQIELANQPECSGRMIYLPSKDEKPVQYNNSDMLDPICIFPRGSTSFKKPEDREIPPPRNIRPDIDRSKKPSDPSTGNTAGADDIDNRFALPAAAQQTFGGDDARIAINRVVEPPEHRSAVVPPAIQPSQPPPPPAQAPTPDRSTKRTVLQQIQPPEPPTLFYNAYEMSINKIAVQSKSNQTRTRFGCTGLVNRGNNVCFMNATLQALFHTPRFSDLFRNKQVARHINTKNSFGTTGMISGSFAALTDLAWSGEFSALHPFAFLDIFAQRVNSALADRQQHDAQEFQIYLLDALHEDTNRVDKGRPFEQNYTNIADLAANARDFIERSRHFSSSPVNDIFNLTTVSILKCKVCSSTSVCFEGLNQISVELPPQPAADSEQYGRPFRLRDCLRTHFSTTQLDAPWDCPNCKLKQAATRTTKIWTVPKILIIHLKRFSFENGQFKKNPVDVNFELDGFDLAPFVHQMAPQYSAPRYNLYAVTNHAGTLNAGHYTSNVKNLYSSSNAHQEWLHFDDERCTRITDRSAIVHTKDAFLLYYSLVEDDGAKE